MTKRKVIIRYLAKHMDKIIIALGYGVLLLFIVARGIPVEWKYIERGMWLETRGIQNDNFVVTYALNSGDNKPVITSPSGEVLIRVDGWESTIQADNGDNRSLWNHIYRSVVVESTSTIMHNMSWGAYQVMQVTTLQENSVTTEYRVSADENIGKISLNLQHYYENFSMVRIGGITINDNYQDDQITGLKYLIDVEASLILSPSVNENALSWALDNAPYWFRLTFSMENVAAGYDWKKIAKVAVSYSPITSA